MLRDLKSGSEWDLHSEKGVILIIIMNNGVRRCETPNMDTMTEERINKEVVTHDKNVAIDKMSHF